LNFCGIVVAILKMATSRNCSMSRINSGHHYLPTYQNVMISDNFELLRYCNESRHWTISIGRHFQNGHHNIAKIQHCPISTSFHMWVDYYVPNWFLTLKNFYWSLFLPTYQIVMISDNVEFLRYCGGHFESSD
jgi:hypothetical protein